MILKSYEHFNSVTKSTLIQSSKGTIEFGIILFGNYLHNKCIQEIIFTNG